MPATRKQPPRKRRGVAYGDYGEWARIAAAMSRITGKPVSAAACITTHARALNKLRKALSEE